jgi:hypothetical protein
MWWLTPIISATCGGEDREDESSRLAGTKKLVRPYFNQVGCGSPYMAHVKRL